MELHGLFCDAADSLAGEWRTGQEEEARNSRNIPRLSCTDKFNYKPNSTDLSTLTYLLTYLLHGAESFLWS